MVIAAVAIVVIHELDCVGICWEEITGGPKGRRISARSGDDSVVGECEWAEAPCESRQRLVIVSTIGGTAASGPNRISAGVDDAVVKKEVWNFGAGRIADGHQT